MKCPNEIRRIGSFPWNSVQNDQNDVNLGAVIDDDENREIFLVKII